jgi:hypothetical protein
MLPVSLDCLRRHWKHWVHKTQDEDNLETLAAWGTQDTGRRQSRDTVNVGCTRHRTKTIYVPHVDSVSRLFVFVLCLVYPTLTVSLDCLRPVFCVPHVDSVSGLFVSRDTVNVGYTKHRTKINNLETLST